jgi:hypothetical protein
VTTSSSSTTPSGSNPASRNNSNVVRFHACCLYDRLTWFGEIQSTILGAILGSIASFLLVLFLVLYLLRKKRLNRSHQGGTTSVAVPFEEISPHRHPSLTPFVLTGTADGRGDHRLRPGARFMKKSQASSSVSELTTGISETSLDNSSQSASTNDHQPPIASSTTATTNMPVNVVPNSRPLPGNSGNNVLIEAMFYLHERLAKLENQNPGDYFHEQQREAPPTYVA